MNIWNVKIIWTAAMVALVCLLTAGQSGAYDPEHLEKLFNTGACVGCDLSGVNLEGSIMQNVDLSGADLSRAYLRRCDMRKANLSRANLTNANLSSSFLSGADLTGATIFRVHLSGALLTGATWTDGKKCAEESIGICYRR